MAGSKFLTKAAAQRERAVASGHPKQWAPRAQWSGVGQTIEKEGRYTQERGTVEMSQREQGEATKEHTSRLNAKETCFDVILARELAGALNFQSHLFTGSMDGHQVSMLKPALSEKDFLLVLDVEASFAKESSPNALKEVAAVQARVLSARDVQG